MGGSAADEEHAKSVVVAVAESSGDSAVKFDESVHGFCAAVVGAVGVEVGQERFPPPFQRASEAGDFGDWAARERIEDLLGDLASLTSVGVAVRGAELLGAGPRYIDGQMCVLVGSDRRFEAFPLLLGEFLGAGAQEVLDPVERVALAASVAQGFLLDPAPAFIDGSGAEFDYVEGIIPTSE